MAAEIQQHELIAKLVADPTSPPPLLVLRGFIGASGKEGSTRLYLDEALQTWADIPDGDILHVQKLPEAASPLGETCVWIKAESQLTYGAGSTQPMTEATMNQYYPEYDYGGYGYGYGQYPEMDYNAGAAMGGGGPAAGPAAPPRPSIPFVCPPPPTAIQQLCPTRLQPWCPTRPAVCPPPTRQVWCPTRPAVCLPTRPVTCPPTRNVRCTLVGPLCNTLVGPYCNQPFPTELGPRCPTRIGPICNRRTIFEPQCIPIPTPPVPPIPRPGPVGPGDWYGQADWSGYGADYGAYDPYGYGTDPYGYGNDPYGYGNDPYGY